MKGASPPLRFLTLVLGGWICLRATVLASDWWLDRPGPPAEAIAQIAATAPILPPPSLIPGASLPPSAGPPLAMTQWTAAPPPIPPGNVLAIPAPALPAGPEATAPAPAPALSLPPALAAAPKRESRWSGSAWLFVRDRGGTPGLAPGGTLGGSQAGGRITYRLTGGTRPLAFSVRAYAPLNSFEGAEAAIGLDWKPLPRAPLHLLAERRQKLGHEGRSAFALTAYGGVSDEPLGPLRLDAYGQAGAVGLRSRDLFADGSARLSLPLGRLKAGGGLWGAAQPGVERLDTGPQLSLRLPAGKASVTIAADWRFRLAGEAEPGDGPALTLSTDF